MRVRSLLLAVLVGLGLGAVEAQARPHHGDRDEDAMQQQLMPDVRGFRGGYGNDNQNQRVIPLREILDMVRSRYGGEFVGLRAEPSRDQPFYVLRWRFPDQSVEDIRVDAGSGRIYR